MTVQRARELLQEELQDSSDEQVLQFIQETNSLGDLLLDLVLKKHLTPQKT